MNTKENDITAAGWQASLDLTLEKKQGKTILAQTRRSGPLTIQQPFYPEKDLCHLYLLHPPGGLVGGDQIRFRADLKPGASALITTPGAGKFYRSGGRSACLDQHLTVRAGALLEWFPQETIIFPGAMASMQTCIDLDDTAMFMGWDILCLGQPAIQKRFEDGHVVSGLAIHQGGTPLLIERMSVDAAADLDQIPGLAGYCVTASFWAGPVEQDLFQKIRDQLNITDPFVGMTLLDNLLVARYLGQSPQNAKEVFLSIRTLLWPALCGREAIMPRIWNT